MNQDKLSRLTDRFSQNAELYSATNSTYSETEVRVEYIDPLFELLGWDMKNAKGLPNSLKEVVREESQIIEETSKRPDYTFRIAGLRKFFVEAKKPSVNISISKQSAFQARRYGWTAGHPIVVLTNFKDIRIYDTRVQPKNGDTTDVALLMKVSYLELSERWQEIENLLSRDLVADGAIEDFMNISIVASFPVNDHFVNQINEWRLSIAKSVWRNHTDLSVQVLGDLSQKIINRLIFLRMCEDRNIEPVEKLRSVAQQQDNLAISELYAYLDHRYNTGLFNTRDDPYNGEYLLDSGVFLEIVEALYYPQAPYDFSVLDADFLGQIYEVFLVQRIVLDGAELKLDTKPAYRDRQVVTTPQSLVDDIVRKTIGGKIAELRSLDDLNLEAILKLKVLDIAVGSGRFLIRSLENLMDEALNCFIETNDTSNFYQLSEGNYKLKFSAKRELLEKCLFGIDIDYNAVEVAKFSLVIKLLEDESNSSIPVGNKILPNLDQNILWGNSIVGTDVSSELTQDEIERVHPFSFDLSGLPNEFDIIIGNPPYQKTEEMRSHSLKEFDYYKYTYGSAHRQFDKYYIFLEKGVQLLKVGGWLGYVVPNKWLTSESATKLRSILSDEVVESITDFGNELLFEDRSTYVCLLVLSKRDKEQFTYRYIDDYTKWIDTSADNGQTLPSEMLKLYSDKAWILPADDLEAGLLKKLILNSKPLSKIIEVFNGLQTSAEDVFPIPHWSDVGNDIIEFEQSGRQWRIEKAITKPYLMDSRNLVKSYLEIGQDALIIYPYIISEDNEPVFIKPHEMQANFPLAWEYLSHHKTRLSARSVSPSPEDGEFYRYGRHQALAKSFTQEKVLYSVNQLGHKYGIDRSGTGFASGGTAGEVALANPNDGYSLYFILGLLNQHAIEFYIRKRGSSFRGGYYSRGTAVISEVPVPVIDFENGQQKELHGIITELVKNRIVTENTLISATGREHAMLVQQKDNLDQNIAEHFNKLWNLSTAEKTVRLRGSS